MDGWLIVLCSFTRFPSSTHAVVSITIISKLIRPSFAVNVVFPCYKSLNFSATPLFCASAFNVAALARYADFAAAESPFAHASRSLPTLDVNSRPSAPNSFAADSTSPVQPPSSSDAASAGYRSKSAHRSSKAYTPPVESSPSSRLASTQSR